MYERSRLRVRYHFGRTLRVLLVSQLFLIFTSCEQLFPRMTESDLNSLRTACEQLPIPPNFRKTQQHTVEKIGSAVYSAQYASDSDSNAIEEYFENELTKNGWNFSGNSDSINRSLEFRKGRILIAIRYSRLLPIRERAYGVSCSWE